MLMDEIALYEINCDLPGPAPGFYKSNLPALADYVFQMPSCVYDNEKLYTLTIYKEREMPNTANDPAITNNQAAGKRRRRKTHRRRR
jgi:hypothetical protein